MKIAPSVAQLFEIDNLPHQEDSLSNSSMHDDSTLEDPSPASPADSPREESDHSSLGSHDSGSEKEAKDNALLLLDQVKQHVSEVKDEATNALVEIGYLDNQCTHIQDYIDEMALEANDIVEVYGGSHFLDVATIVKIMAEINLLIIEYNTYDRDGTERFLDSVSSVTRAPHEEDSARSEAIDEKDEWILRQIMYWRHDDNMVLDPDATGSLHESMESVGPPGTEPSSLSPDLWKRYPGLVNYAKTLHAVTKKIHSMRELGLETATSSMSTSLKEFTLFTKFTQFHMFKLVA